jgi:tetratricopeptide (TPR) repeat protein
MKQKILLLTIFLFCACTSIFAQYKVTIEAYLYDKETQQPLQFGNVEFIGTNIKAISDSDGKFVLVYLEEAVGAESIFKCSVLGYQNLTVKSAQLFRLLQNSNKIYLTPKPFVSGKSIDFEGNIFGKIVSQSQPIQGATVKIKNSFKEVLTDVDGYYRIDAKEDDILVVNYLGMLEKQVIVTSENEINIELQSDGELLDEVLLEGKKKAEAKIETGLGKKSEESIGYSVNTITADDITIGSLSLADIIVGKFAGVQVAGLNVGYNRPQVIIRGGGGSITNPIPAIFVVDGMIYTEMPDFIDVQQIDNISILKSLAATNRFGTIGAGGAFLIRMKTTTAGQAKKAVPDLLAKGNDYIENVIAIKDAEIKPQYIVQLENTNSFEAAKRIYTSQRQNNERLEIPYFLDVSDYFKKWDENYAHNILMYISEIAYDNPKALKILAYKLESQGKYEEAKQIYQRILVLRPKQAQSYRDLALIYEATGNYEEAMELYAQMLGNKIDGVDFTSLTNVITNELKHLLALNRDKVDYSNVDAEFLDSKFKIDLRMVFDYNDTNTEFDLQFVNPQKKFYKWSHSRLENMDRMLDEIKNGYASEEYIIDDADKGEWIINLECFSEESSTNPTYLKYTVFKNYGLPKETKEVHIIKLYQYQQKVTLDKFMYKK